MKTKDEPIYRGILFSKLMMEANLGGRKMETRRVIKRIPEAIDSIVAREDGIFELAGSALPSFKFPSIIRSPYGKPGDIIYAKETIWTNKYNGGLVYDKELTYPNGNWKCTPSIHMPKIQSRFWAELLEVRAERLLDISGNSCVLEGIEYQYNGWRDYMALCDLKHGTPCYDQNFGPRKSYLSLWDSINGKDSHLLNPWVWVLAYKEVPKPNF